MRCANFQFPLSLLVLSVVALSASTKGLTSPEPDPKVEMTSVIPRRQQQQEEEHQQGNQRHQQQGNDIQQGSAPRHKRWVRVVSCPLSSANLTTVFARLRARVSISSFFQPARQGRAYKYSKNHHPLRISGWAIPVPHHPRNHDHASTSFSPFHLVAQPLHRGYYPSSVYFAQCSCGQCRHYSAMRCVPVYSHVVVLRPAGCLQGMQLYRTKIIALPTSCKCAGSVMASSAVGGIDSAAEGQVAGIPVNASSQAGWGVQ